MNCLLFANFTLKKTLEKNTWLIREFCQSRKVGTVLHLNHFLS